jgi:hypothetical protein
MGREIACSEQPHYPEEAGRTGRILADRALPGTPAHRFLVIFDRPVPVVRMGAAGMMPLSARHYAADELEPAD